MHFIPRLGKLMRAESIEEILYYCEEFFPGEPPEYFFDRNPDNFPQILDMYRSVGFNIRERRNAKFENQSSFIGEPTNVSMMTFFSSHFSR